MDEFLIKWLASTEALPTERMFQDPEESGQRSADRGPLKAEMNQTKGTK